MTDEIRLGRLEHSVDSLNAAIRGDAQDGGIIGRLAKIEHMLAQQEERDKRAKARADGAWLAAVGAMLAGVGGLVFSLIGGRP